MNPMKKFSLLLALAILLTCCLSAPAFAANVDDFADVPANAWYRDYAAYAAENGMVTGTSDTTFSPNDNITRAQFITILYRALGQNEIITPDNEFCDIPASSYYRDAVYWGQAHAIIYGMTETAFAPNKDITRQEATVMLGRAITSLSIHIPDAEAPVEEFTDDASIADWAKDAVDIMRQKQLISGYTDGSFRPKKNMTRAEGTTILVRFVQAMDAANNDEPEPDPSPSADPTPVPSTTPTPSPSPTPEAPKDIDRIHFISQGGTGSDAILVESKGKYMMVDAGNPDPSLGLNYAYSDDNCNGNAVAAYLQAIGVTHLDYLVMTHNHSDHIGGVPILCSSGLIDSNTTVYYRSSKSTDEDIYTDYQNMEYLNAALSSLKSVKANIVCLLDTNTTTLSFDMGDYNISFRNLDEDHDGKVDFYTAEENRNSIVLRITKGSVSALLAADLDLIGEKKLLANGGLSDIDILKLSHHGYLTANSFAWLNETNPSAAILTRDQWYTGENDGMTSYACLKDRNVPVYACDDQKKAIVFTIHDTDYSVSDVDNAFHQVPAAVLGQTIADGFYYWDWKTTTDHNTVKIENGKMVKNNYRTDNYGFTYYFDSNGIGTKQ